MAKLARRLLAAVGAAAAAMYFFDPENGRRRRAIFRDRAAAELRRLGRSTARRSRYLAGKSQGLTHRFAPSGGGASLNDATLQHKIESEVLRDHPKGKINVNVEEGVAVLRGELETSDQINTLIEDVREVDGITEVRSLLHLSGTPAPTWPSTERSPRL